VIKYKVYTHIKKFLIKFIEYQLAWGTEEFYDGPHNCSMSGKKQHSFLLHFPSKFQRQQPCDEGKVLLFCCLAESSIAAHPMGSEQDLN